MADAVNAQLPKPKVFISYARKDMAFADRLVAALESRGLVVTIDRRDLPLLEEWQRELIGFIRAADAVIYLISPAAIASKWCEWEVAQVVALSKRLAPVVIEPVTEGIPDAIRKINFLFFTPPNEFESQADKLVRALNTDIGWVKEHTRLGERARRWDEGKRADALLVRGQELVEAESWILRRPPEAPRPTELHREFIQASRAGEQARAEKEREQVARTRRFQKRSAWALAGVAVLVLSGMAAAMWQSRTTEIREAAVMTSLAHQAYVDGLYDRAMRIALQGLPPPGAAPWSAGWDNKVMRGLEAKLAGGAHESRLVAQFRSGQWVDAATFSPDNKRILTQSSEGTGIWDIASGKLIAALKHDIDTRSAISPDGRHFVTASVLDKTVRLWDANTFKEIVVLINDISHHPKIVFSHEGNRLLVWDNDRIARVWDAASAKLLAVREWPSGIAKLAISATSRDGTRIAAVSKDGSVRVWDALSGLEMTIQGAQTDHKSSSVIAWLPSTSTSVTFSPDGRRILINNGTAQVWDAISGHLITTLKGHEVGERETFSPDASRIFTTASGNTAHIWDAESGERTAILDGHRGMIKAASFSPDGNRIVTASSDGTARIWSVASGEEIIILKGHSDLISGAVFSPDGTRIVTSSIGSGARVWDAGASAVIGVVNAHKDVQLAALSPDNTKVALVGASGLGVWDTKSWERVLFFNAIKGQGIPFISDGGPIIQVAFNPAGTRIVTNADGDSTARVWDVVKGKEVLHLKGHNGQVRSAAFSPDGTRIVTASYDNTARVWNAVTGNEIAVLVGHTKGVRSAAFSPDGASIVTGSEDETAKVWDAATGQVIATFVQEQEEGATTTPREVVAASFKLGSGRIIILTQAGRVAEIDLSSVRGETRILRGNEHVITRAAFSPDASRILTITDSVGIWDSASGELVSALGKKKDFPDESTATFSPDGTRVATASYDNSVRIWDVRWATKMRGYDLRDAVCTGKLNGVQAFTAEETDDPVLEGLQGTSPCDRRGPLSLLYWARLPDQLWMAIRSAWTMRYPATAPSPSAPPPPAAN